MFFMLLAEWNNNNNGNGNIIKETELAHTRSFPFILYCVPIRVSSSQIEKRGSKRGSIATLIFAQVVPKQSTT